MLIVVDIVDPRYVGQLMSLLWQGTSYHLLGKLLHRELKTTLMTLNSKICK